MHRARPRYGRIVVLSVSLVLTAGAAGAAIGLVPYGDGDKPADTAAADESEPMPEPASAARHIGHDSPPGHGAPPTPDDSAASSDHGDAPPRVPAGSGQGRRVVYDMSAQRVWLVGPRGGLLRSYPVSGSMSDNLRPGSYDVYSRSRHTVAFDQQSTMNYMVRFTEGDIAAIGFHDIPEDLAGQPVQTVDQLGTARSHGCIRQRTADAREMWRFATIGTPVRVLA
jgi:lipoprotein-anchoring transpeptidase ErfK/SrfK